jgi:hypothetical protein
LLHLADVDVCVLMLDIISGNEKISSLAVFSAEQAKRLAPTVAPTEIYTKLTLGRDKWEEAFDKQMIQPRMGANLARIINEFKLKRSKRILSEAILLRQQIDEHNSAFPYHNLFRTVADKSKKAMRAAMNEESVRRIFPFLNIFWESEPHLHLIRHLVPLVRWVNLIMLRYAISILYSVVILC